MPIKSSHVHYVYRNLLGRRPESLHIVGQWMQAKNVHAMIGVVLGSQEFLQRDWEKEVTKAVRCRHAAIAVYALALIAAFALGAFVSNGWQ